MMRFGSIIGLSVAMLALAAGCSGPGASERQSGATAARPATTATAGTASHETSKGTENGQNMETAKDGNNTKLETAMFGAGCFWGVEAKFMETPGVVNTAVGYAGGKTDKPTYKEVCTDRTGHAEVVHIEFDPAKTSYEQLVEVFFANHDPTQVNRQGPDVGTQYRSAIFYYSPEQKQTAERVKEKLAAGGKFKRPIATEIAAAPTFWPAEEYHQKYLQKRGLTSCGTGH